MSGGKEYEKSDHVWSSRTSVPVFADGDGRLYDSRGKGQKSSLQYYEGVQGDRKTSFKEASPEKASYNEASFQNISICQPPFRESSFGKSSFWTSQIVWRRWPGPAFSGCRVIDMGKEKVISVAAYNDEGKRIIEKLSLKGKKYTEAIDLLVESEDMKSCLTDQSEFVFTVAAAGSRQQAIRTGLESCASRIGYHSSSFSTDLSLVAKAHEYAVSVGRYSAYLELARYDESITVDDCRHMTMTEIHGLIDEHHQNEGHHGEGHH